MNAHEWIAQANRFGTQRKRPTELLGPTHRRAHHLMKSYSHFKLNFNSAQSRQFSYALTLVGVATRQSHAVTLVSLLIVVKAWKSTSVRAHWHWRYIICSCLRWPGINERCTRNGHDKVALATAFAFHFIRDCRDVFSVVWIEWGRNGRECFGE